MSVGRYAFGREVQVQRTGVQEKWRDGEMGWWSGGVVEWWSGGVVEWWSALFVNTAAEGCEFISRRDKCYHYPK
jgi:hypothetical protein